MISEFEVIRMLLEIQAAPADPPAEMIVKTKDTIIREGIKKMLDRAESVQKPERSAGKAEQTAEKSSGKAEKPEQKSTPPLIREKEMTQAKIAQPPSGGVRPKFDKGKLLALRRAGWTVKAIAEEMKCSEQTVRNHMKKEKIK